MEELKRSIKAVVRQEMGELREQDNQPTETHVDHVCGCPDCLCGVMDKLKKTSEVECASCGLPLGTKEVARKISECPMCGETDTLPYERDEE